ncbi:hypothetical protein DSBG_4326 [Desulfosporosinus sp. BG]|nr:hypothetical protein DSBG_4326 [Desulfosporosinus sp. BG]
MLIEAIKQLTAVTDNHANDVSEIARSLASIAYQVEPCCKVKNGI